MTLLLDVWSALVLGVLYLAFEAFPIIFGEIHGFNTAGVGMSFIGIGLGMFIALATQPLWNRCADITTDEIRSWLIFRGTRSRLYRKTSVKHNGDPPPEIRLYMGALGGVLVSSSEYTIALLFHFFD